MSEEKKCTKDGHDWKYERWEKGPKLTYYRCSKCGEILKVPF